MTKVRGSHLSDEVRQKVASIMADKEAGMSLKDIAVKYWIKYYLVVRYYDYGKALRKAGKL